MTWVPGVVKSIDEVEETVVKATIKWDSTCIGEGESDESVEKLKKYKWNPDKPDDGAWREDLRHLMRKIDWFLYPTFFVTYATMIIRKNGVSK